MDDTVIFEVLGRSFKLKVDDSNEVDINLVLERFRTEIDEIESSLDRGKVIPDREAILLLAGLNIVGEYFGLSKVCVDFLNCLDRILFSAVDK